MDRVDARLVVVAGDVRALQMLRDELPKPVAELVQEVGGGRAAGAQGADPEEVERLVAQLVAEDERMLLGKLAEELGQHDRGRSGVAGTVASLTAAQVEVLLVHDDATTAAPPGSPPVTPPCWGPRPGDPRGTPGRRARAHRAGDGRGRADAALARRRGRGVGAILRWA